MHSTLQQQRFAHEQVDTVPLRSQKLVLQPQPTGIGMNISYYNPHRNDYQMLPGAMQLQQPSTGLHGALPWGPAPPASAPLQVQHSTGSSMLSTHSAYQLDEAAAGMQGEGDLHTFFNEDRAAAAARPRDVNLKGRRYQPKAGAAAPQSQQLQQAMSVPQHAQPATLQELLAAHAQHAPASAPQDQHGMASMQQEPAGGTMLEGQDSADGLDLLMLVIQATEKADAQQGQHQQTDPPQQPAPDSKHQAAQDALLAACAEALGQAQHSNQAEGPVLGLEQGHWHAHAGAATASGTPDEPMHALEPASAAYASTDDDNDAAARDAHMRHAIAAALAAVESRGAETAGGLASRGSRSQVADLEQPAGLSSRPKRAAAREADILRQVMLREEAMRKRPVRKGSSQHSVALQHAAQLQQQRQEASAGLPPLPHKKRRSSSPIGRKRRSDVMGVLQPSPAASGNNSAAPPTDAGAAENSKQGQAASKAVLKRKRGPGSKDATAMKPSAPSQQADAAASEQRSTAAPVAAEPTHSVTKAAAAQRRKQTQAAPDTALSSNLAAANTGPSAATPAAAKASAVAAEQAAASKSGGSTKAATELHTAQAGSAGIDPTSEADAAAMQRAAADRPPRRMAAAHASQQIAAGSGGSKAVASQVVAPVSGGRTAGPQAQRNKHGAAGASKPKPSAAAAASEGVSAQAIKAGPAAAPKARVRPAKRAAAKAGSSDGSGSDYEQSSSSGFSSSDEDEDDAEYGAAKRRGSVSKVQQQSGSSKAADGVVEPKKAGPKGGRPLGAANKHEMQPRKKNADGVAAYGCRSQRFRGVYMCQRVSVRWRTQFSYGRKVRSAHKLTRRESASCSLVCAGTESRANQCAQDFFLMALLISLPVAAWDC